MAENPWAAATISIMSNLYFDNSRYIEIKVAVKLISADTSEPEQLMEVVL